MGLPYIAVGYARPISLLKYGDAWGFRVSKLLIMISDSFTKVL